VVGGVMDVSHVMSLPDVPLASKQGDDLFLPQTSVQVVLCKRCPAAAENRWQAAVALGWMAGLLI